MEQTKPKTTRRRRSKPRPSLPLVDVYVQPVRPALVKRHKSNWSTVLWCIKLLVLIALFVGMVLIATGYISTSSETEYINPVLEINGRPITVE